MQPANRIALALDSPPSALNFPRSLQSELTGASACWFCSRRWARNHFEQPLRHLSVLSFDKARMRPGSSFFQNSNDFHRNLVHLLSDKVTMNRIRRVNVLAAERQTFPANIATFWKEEFLRTATCSVASRPQVPCCFPDLQVVVVGGNSPGTQMVDFLLWAALRKYGPAPVRNCDWADRVGLVLSSEWSELTGPLRRINLHIGKRLPALTGVAVRAECLKVPADPESDDKLCAYFAWSESNIHQLFRYGLPEHAAHMAEEIARTANSLQSTSISIDQICEMAGVALRLIDTIPLYDPTNKHEVHFAIDAKNMLGIVFLGRETRWFGIATQWLKLRGILAQEQSHLLGWAH